MILLDTMPTMELMDRQRLVGWIVRDAITNQGISFSDASRRWPMSLPTLNRLMRDGIVGLRFYRTAEINLQLPSGLLEMVINGDADGIRQAPGAPENPGLTPELREYILREMGAAPSKP